MGYYLDKRQREIRDQFVERLEALAKDMRLYMDEEEEFQPDFKEKNPGKKAKLKALVRYESVEGSLLGLAIILKDL